MSDIKRYIQVLESELIPIEKKFQELQQARNDLLSKIEQCQALELEISSKLATINYSDVKTSLAAKFQGKRKIECVTIIALEKVDRIINLREVADTLIEVGIYEGEKDLVINAIQSALAQLKDLWKSLGDKMYQYIG